MRWCCVWRPSKSPAIPEGKSWDARARKRSGAMGGHFRGSPITSSVVFKWSAMQSEEWRVERWGSDGARGYQCGLLLLQHTDARSLDKGRMGRSWSRRICEILRSFHPYGWMLMSHSPSKKILASAMDSLVLQFEHIYLPISSILMTILFPCLSLTVT